MNIDLNDKIVITCRIDSIGYGPCQFRIPTEIAVTPESVKVVKYRGNQKKPKKRKNA